MTTKQEITKTIKAQFANIKTQSRVLARALKARADIAAVRHRLRRTFADLGEQVYEQIESGKSKGLSGDTELAAFKTRIDGLKAELRQREDALKKILEAEKEEEEAAPKKKAAKAKKQTEEPSA